MARSRRLLLVAGLLCGALGMFAGGGLGAILMPRQAWQARELPSLVRAKTRSPYRYGFARRQGATIARTPDRRSFYIFWPGERRGGTVIVTLHGYFATAIDDFAYWHRYAAPRGYGILALQWRLGSESSQSYTPGEIYGQATRILRARGIRPGGALLHGYSSSAARTYGIAALDRRAAHYFRLFIANAGGANRRVPLWNEVFGGGYGPRSLRGTSWVLFCGGRDRDPDTGCPLMRSTSVVIRRRGGRVQRLIVDPVARHGGFLANPASVGSALAIFARLVGG